MAAAAPSSASSSSLFTQSCGSNCFDGTLAVSQYLSSFVSNNYSNTILPNSPDSPVVVNVLVSLTSLLGLSTSGQLSVLLTLLLSWTDEKLHWSPASFHGVNFLYVSADNIWTPELTVLNPSSGGTTSIRFDDLAYLSCNGTVQVLTTVELETSCSLDLDFFPYDSQACFVKFANFLYSSKDVMFNVFSANATTGDFSNNKEWQRLWTRVSVANQSILFNVQGTEYVTFSILRFDIALSRNPYYYMANLVIPTIIMIFLVAFVFLLPADSGEKVSYAATLMLALYVLQQVISLLVPSSQDLPHLTKAMLFSFCMSALACVTSVISVLIRTISADLQLTTQLAIITRLSFLIGQSHEEIIDFLKKESYSLLQNKNLTDTKSTEPIKSKFLDQKDCVKNFARKLLSHKQKTQRFFMFAEAQNLSWQIIDFIVNLCLLFAYVAVSAVYIVLFIFVH